jgi:acetyl esterase/lipase
MGKYNIHRDLQKYENMKFKLNPAMLPIINAFLTISLQTKKAAKGIIVSKKKIPGYQGEMIGLTIYEPEGIEKNAPCLIYLHGGAFYLKAATYHNILICEYALRTPCKVIFVDYRLAPKHAFPVGVEDCYAAFDWVCKNAEALDIDINRIAIGGDSAGGALAAAVTHMARDRKAQNICFQMLVYPVTDAKQVTETMKNYIDTPIWNAEANKKMWELYLRDGDHNLRTYASPMEATSFENLPDAYVEVSEFDCLRDEGIHYAEALRQNGCQVELNKTVGTVHGFELAIKSEITSMCVERRIAALKRAFNPVNR